MRNIRIGTHDDAKYFEKQEEWEYGLYFESESEIEYFVMELNGTPASIAVVCDRELSRLYTLKKFRGQKLGKGLATYVIDKIINDKEWAEVEFTAESGEFWIAFASEGSFEFESDAWVNIVFRRKNT